MNNIFSVLKALQFILFSFPLLFSLGCSLSKRVAPIEISTNRTEALIIDHTCTRISQIPERWIKKKRKPSLEFPMAIHPTAAR